jgi:Sec-independent protein translocase protein TatA
MWDLLGHKFGDLILSVASSSGLLFVGLAITSPEGWGSLWEKGGLALVIIVSIFLLGRATVPSLANWVKTYLEGLETRNAETQRRWEARMDQSQDKFLAELASERLYRKDSENAFREMLHSHKTETVGAIKEQTEQITELVRNVKAKPCLLKINKDA